MGIEHLQEALALLMGKSDSGTEAAVPLNDERQRAAVDENARKGMAREQGQNGNKAARQTLAALSTRSRGTNRGY